MDQMRAEFLGEVKSGFLSLFLLAQIRNRTRKAEQALPYTQALMDSALEKMGAKASTCFSRLRLLRLGGFIEQRSGSHGGKGVMGYMMTNKGELLLGDLLDQSRELLKSCEDLGGKRNG